MPDQIPHPTMPPVPMPQGGIPVDVVLTFLLAAPEEVTDILSAINPPSLPRFQGEARIVVGNDVPELHQYLEGKAV